MLDEERKYFDEHLSDLLKQHSGRVVLIRGSKLVGVFDDEPAALAEGARLYGLQPFLVRRVLPASAEAWPPALSLGILRGKMPPTEREPREPSCR